MDTGRTALQAKRHKASRTTTPALLVLSALMAASSALTANAAEPAAGENQKIFLLLCRAVTAVEETRAAPKLGDEQEADAKRATDLAFYLEAQEAVDEVAKTNAKEKIEGLPDEQVAAKCKKTNLEKCKSAALWLKNMEASAKQQIQAAARSDTNLKQILNTTLKQISAAKTNAETKTAEHDGGKKSQDKLVEAVYGSETNRQEPKIIANAPSRQAACGTGETTPGTTAGESIVATLACLCSSNSGTDNKGCLKTGAPRQTSWEANTAIAAWQQIKSRCTEAATGTKTRGSTELEAAIQGIRTELYTAKGTDHDAIGFLGTKHGTGKGDCDGDHATNKGACANFKKANGEVDEPKWLTNLQAAATAARQEEEKERAVAQAVARIRTLNSTLTTLLATSMIATQLGDHKQTVPTTTIVGDKSKNQQEEAEKDCNKVNSEDECRGKTDCTYDKPDKKCTLSKEAKKKAEKAAKQETGGKDDKKDRCNKHGTDKTKCEAENTAGQTPVCGFRKGKDGETDEPEKEKCRNGSFLTSKQFALSVVSAAFVALLF
ncbi:Trypanosome variant surface glycoprotein C-terminal domain containing protein [Trypanosoma brucei equiperdum]|uniref:Trypanosome variant surface glycoprotein C-terminal domain containing protein n=1 Tax=Trypanosoma brucei equiperdum TaxID=630700 RepID=A0A3L6LGR5_9TRYP|nr:Trypanosome variant surface glycoprotein C-terminal domain containing protein [Trypanosoma brucei equiperdum]